jgi:hypothetical protein
LAVNTGAREGDVEVPSHVEPCMDILRQVFIDSFTHGTQNVSKVKQLRSKGRQFLLYENSFLCANRYGHQNTQLKAQRNMIGQHRKQ